MVLLIFVESVDFKFDYIVLKFRTCDSNWRSRYGWNYTRIRHEYSTKPDGNMDISKLKRNKKYVILKPELTSELIQLSEWMSHYHVMKRISV